VGERLGTVVTDWGAIGEYVKDVSKAQRSLNSFVKRGGAPGDAGDGDNERLSAFRAYATHLDQRLGAGAHIEAAFGGLQDSAPRAGLIALHARMDSVGPGAWEDPALVQIWLRRADYLVPRRDVKVFTVGALPRLPAQRAALDHLADAVLRVLDGQAKTAREVALSLPDLPAPNVLRLCSVTGKVHIRWDARSTVLVPAVLATVRTPAEPAPPAGMDDLDEEEARRELARRFLGWLGPARAVHFAAWAGVGRDDAEATWHCLHRELAVVRVNGVEANIMARDEEAFWAASAGLAGVRLLPMGDPYLYPRAALPIEAPRAEVAEQLRQQGATSRVINSLTGRVLADGRVVASWGRSGPKVTLAAWHGLSPTARQRIAAEVDALSGPLGRPVTMEWLA
jgi:hypothetical protein